MIDYISMVMKMHVWMMQTSAMDREVVQAAAAHYSAIVQAALSNRAIETDMKFNALIETCKSASRMRHSTTTRKCDGKTHASWSWCFQPKVDN